MQISLSHYAYRIPYNLLMLTIGGLIIGIGVKGIAIPHGFISGGLSGLSLLIYYWTGLLTPGVLYFLLNVPIFLLGWRYISRRFFYYSFYGMAILTLTIDLIKLEIAVQDPMLAALVGGCLMGCGSGVIFHSLGSVGGNDVVAVFLNQRFNIRIGTFFFLFNIGLFAFSFTRLPADLVLFSRVMSFVTSQVMEYVLNISNQRKMALIISEHSNQIAPEILSRLGRGVTFLEGRGAYTGNKKNVVLTVINSFQLKRLEELVFTIDSQAFVIVENTLNVIGKGFSRRKTY